MSISYMLLFLGLPHSLLQDSPVSFILPLLLALDLRGFSIQGSLNRLMLFPGHFPAICSDMRESLQVLCKVIEVFPPGHLNVDVGSIVDELPQ